MNREARIRQWHRPGSRALLQQLYLTYHLEDPAMSYTMADFIRETHQQLLHNMTPEERQAFLDELPAEERLKGLDPEELLKRLDPEQVKAWLRRCESE